MKKHTKLITGSQGVKDAMAKRILKATKQESRNRGLDSADSQKERVNRRQNEYDNVNISNVAK